MQDLPIKLIHFFPLEKQVSIWSPQNYEKIEGMQVTEFNDCYK